MKVSIPAGGEGLGFQALIDMLNVEGAGSRRGTLQASEFEITHQVVVPAGKRAYESIL